MLQRDRIGALLKFVQRRKVWIGQDNRDSPVSGVIRCCVVEKLVAGQNTSLLFFLEYGDRVGYDVPVERSTVPRGYLEEQYPFHTPRGNLDVCHLLSGYARNPHRDHDCNHYEHKR
jgi:hypothetical protein